MSPRRIARVVDRGSDQVVLERDITSWDEAAVERWYLQLVQANYFVEHRLEWPEDAQMEDS